MSKQSLPAEMDVWILAGQSNMEGVGELKGVLPPSEQVWNFTSAGSWEIAVEPLHRLWESFTPVNQQIMRAVMVPTSEAVHQTDAELAAAAKKNGKFGAGLGMAFAQSMFARTARPVGLISAAHGGTSLAQWAWNKKAEGGKSLYGAMLERVARSGRKPKGLLWYQGESEAWNLEAAQTYGRDFGRWIEQVRADLGDPNLPVLLVQIGRTIVNTINPAGWNAVQHQQYQLPDLVPNTAVTSAVDLPLVDGIHISTSGLKRLGIRLAGMASLLLAGTKGSEIGPRLTKVTQDLEAPGRLNVDLSFTGVTRAWLPADHIAGFDVLGKDGHPHPNSHVVNAYRHPTIPTSIRVMVEGPLLEEGEKIVYAHGARTYCNAVDEGDFPLCAMTMSVN